jgi:hypothetical protein
MPFFGKVENVAESMFFRTVCDNDLFNAARVCSQCLKHGRNAEDNIARRRFVSFDAIVLRSKRTRFGLVWRSGSLHISKRRIREYFVN